MYRYGFVLALINFSYEVFGSASKENVGVEKLLELGRDFLSSGRYQDALMHYHQAVEQDPDNYMTYYKRGTVFMALGKAKSALADFDKALELKPDFTPARLQRGNVHLKQAELDKAENDFTEALQIISHHEDATAGLSKLYSARDQIRDAEAYFSYENYPTAASLLTQAIEICSWSPYLRKLRSKCRMNMGDFPGAVSDMRSTTKLTSDNTEGYFELSALLYELGQVDDALKEIRECLKLDPEHSKCFPFYKKIKKVAKFIQDSEQAEGLSDNAKCSELANKILKLEPSFENVRFIAYQRLCKCNRETNINAALENCQSMLKIQKDPDTLCDAAETYLEAELYDQAIRYYQEAKEIDSNHQRAKEGVQKAQKRQKQSESRDYYKILGVPRNAKKQQIIKAYRKAAQKWHPDNFKEGEEKKLAEKKFIDIAAAKEVLTDDEKRAKFDRGEDPLDPESGRHQGFNPFQEFNQFHYSEGSPFTFKFHF